jgi:hypothetical protein
LVSNYRKLGGFVGVNELETIYTLKGKWNNKPKCYHTPQGIGDDFGSFFKRQPDQYHKNDYITGCEVHV